MFDDKSFEIFEIEGLDNRMAAIRATIQPVFTELNEYFVTKLSAQLSTDLHIHIAQHRRRTVYPPENTWSALSQEKRGYKMLPHFQLGIWPEYVFMWLSLIDNPKNEQKIAQSFLNNSALFAQLPADFYISVDHTQPKVERVTEADLNKSLLRFKDVKKGEFQIGRIIHKNDELWQDPIVARQYMLETYELMLPLYQLAMSNAK